LFDTFLDHLRLVNSRGEVETPSRKAHISRPFVISVKLAPNSSTTHKFTCPLGHRYELLPGSYTVSLVYPLSLLPRANRPAKWRQDWSHEAFLLLLPQGVAFIER
jgi:hypothetical protein